jgi:RNA polymerase sigma-70 factor (ECF subfamily)
MALRRTHHRTGPLAVSASGPDEPFAQRLLEAYVRAWANDDIDGLLAIMREDVQLAMPPSPAWYQGRDSIEIGLRNWIFGALRPPAGYAARATTANGQPAFVIAPTNSPDRPIGLAVLTVAAGKVASITVFLDEKLAARF